MKNVTLTYNELQLNLFYAVSYGLQNVSLGKNLHIIPEVTDREYIWRVVENETFASSAVSGKWIFVYRINKGDYQMNDIRTGVVTSYLRDQADKFLEQFYFENPDIANKILDESKEFQNNVNGIYALRMDERHVEPDLRFQFYISENNSDEPVIFGRGKSWLGAMHSLCNDMNVLGYDFDQNLNVVKIK